MGGERVCMVILKDYNERCCSYDDGYVSLEGRKLCVTWVYDSFSVEPFVWISKTHESESGQMRVKKVIRA